MAGGEFGTHCLNFVRNLLTPTTLVTSDTPSAFTCSSVGGHNTGQAAGARGGCPESYPILVEALGVFDYEAHLAVGREERIRELDANLR